jgi:hypothetical protein
MLLEEVVVVEQLRLEVWEVFHILAELELEPGP